MNTELSSNIQNQTLSPPIEELALVFTHIKLLKTSTSWADVGIFVDENHKATLILLLLNNEVKAILRFCLSVEESVNAIDNLRNNNGDMLFGCYQGYNFTREQILSLDDINKIWTTVPEQIVKYTLDEVKEFYQRMEKGSKKIGRGKDINIETKRKVMQDSHGRCMFEGCGEDLGFDKLTGIEGNFSYLAHNIASSENAARSTIGLSDKLSNEPSNILLMCDRHHRLIDRVAAADYTAQTLSKMRRDFIDTANGLLNGLSFQPIPAFSIAWPVHRQVIAPPSVVQIAQCMSKINARLDSQINDISDNEALLREADPQVIRTLIPSSIDVAAEKIIMQGQGSRHRAALFAFGLMPPLIGLGAKIGNKNDITPMLRYRDGGQWIWPADEPKGAFYTIEGLETLTDNEPEIILALALSANPKSFNTASSEINNKTKAKTIIIKAFDDSMGNGALSHPDDGITFMKDMQKLLHNLNDNYGVKKIHFLPCASNAACVYFGKAFDSHHPDILVYDFEGETMKPQLLITNNNNKCSIQLPS